MVRGLIAFFIFNLLVCEARIDIEMKGEKRSNIDRLITRKQVAVNLDLGGTWAVTNTVGNVSINGIVPGEIHGDLMASGVIGDAYYRYNDIEYRWVLFQDWIYSRNFEVSNELLQQQVIDLVCYGIDTISTVLVNGQQVGTTDNQFRRYIFSIKNLLVLGTNHIEVRIKSAATYVTEKTKAYGYDLNESTSQQHSHGELGRNFIRKEQNSFAWDWGPCFAPQGIWRPIEILGYTSPLLVDVYPEVYNERDGLFKVVVSADIKSNGNLGGTLVASVAGIEAYTAIMVVPGTNTVELEFSVPSNQVRLWWPVGYGDPNLYDLETRLTFTDGSTTQEIKRIGFRSAELVEDPYPDQEGSSFYFRINGVPIWSKGSNLIPMDSFESRVTQSTVDRLLANARDANMNTLRIWGGGIYQNDYLYDRCDEMGLMVWEEFMFACALYPSDKEFLGTVKEEVIYQVKRLMHHASIVIWSGNNENEQAITERWFLQSIRNPYLYAIDYDRLYHQTIRETLLTIDESRKYLSSSPANGVIVYEPFTERWITDNGESSNSQKYGDNHYYNYRPDCEDVYTMVSPRFSSEYGFQSMPSFETLRPISEPEDWTWDSAFLKFRNHRTGDGQQEIADQMQHHFRFPTNSDRFVELENYIYLSQASQSLCYRAQTEHYRRSKTQAANTMGALYWQLNDIWQAPTWSSLEYGGRWKMLQYYVKRFFSPLLISSYRKSFDVLDVHITSDIVSPISGTWTLEVWGTNGQRLNVTTTNFELESLGSKSVFEKPISEVCSSLQCVVILKVNAVARDTQVQYQHDNFFFPTKPKDIEFTKASINWNVTNQSGDIISMTLTSTTVAPFVFLDTPIFGRFSDNGFVMVPGQTYRIDFIAWEPTTIDKFVANLRVRSLADTLPQEK